MACHPDPRSSSRSSIGDPRSLYSDRPPTPSSTYTLPGYDDVYFDSSSLLSHPQRSASKLDPFKRQIKHDIITRDHKRFESVVAQLDIALNMSSSMLDSEKGSEPEPNPASDAHLPHSQVEETSPGSDWSFIMVMASLAFTVLLSALDLTAISTAIPRIANDLKMRDFTWLGSSYALASTALLPLFGSLAAIFGRKPLLMSAVVLFAVGSALCGSAHSQSQMIAGRTIAGAGGGGFLALQEILVADMVPLNKRGLYMGIFGAVWARASAVGPITGGALALTNWRWLFWLNIPVCAISLLLITIFLNFKVPTTTLKEKLVQIDWLGSLLFVGSVTSLCIGLTWAGGVYKWLSIPVLVSLCAGVAGLLVFFLVEWYLVKEATVPKELLSNRTTVIGYVATFVHGIVVIALVYYLPLWLQTAKLKSPMQSGIALFGLSFSIAPLAMVAGAIVTVTARYKYLNIIGWALLAGGFGLLTLYNSDSPSKIYATLMIVPGIGAGILYTATMFPVLAPLPVESTAHALGFYAFSRYFGQVIGVVMGSTILVNTLNTRLPSSLLVDLGPNTNIVYAPIPLLKTLPLGVRIQTMNAFTDSTRFVWIACAALSGLGMLVSLFMRDLELQKSTDQRYAMQEKVKIKPTKGQRVAL